MTPEPPDETPLPPAEPPYDASDPAHDAHEPPRDPSEPPADPSEPPRATPDSHDHTLADHMPAGDPHTTPDASVDRDALSALFATTGDGAADASALPPAHHHHRSQDGGHGAADTGHGHRRHRRSPRRRRALIWTLSIAGALVIVVGVAAVAGAMFVRQAISAKNDLTAAKAKIATMPALIEQKNTAAINAQAADVKTMIDRAQKTTQGPLWSVAAAVPFVGVNVSAVQDATQAAGILVDDALPPGLQLMQTLQLDQLRVKGGGVNIAPLKQAEKDLPAVTDAFTRAQHAVAGIDRTKLLPVISDAVGGMLDIVDQTTPTLQTAQKILPTVLPMLGSNGPRNYLLVFQNNAEIRATGGNPAATAQVRVNNGHVTLVDQASSATFYEAGTVRHRYVKLPQSMLQIYPQDTTWYSQNYTRTPNFPTTAKLFDGVWKATTNQKLDGVISIDPVVLSRILSVTGPVRVDGQSLTSQNVVKAVLSDAYTKYPTGAQSDAYFAQVSAAVFQKLTAGQWQPAAMLEQLQDAAHDQRVYAWFANPAEEALAVQAGVDGQLPTDNAKTTQVGVFLNDYTVGKLEYWLQSSVNVTCKPATRQVTTTITLRNNTPSDTLAPYVRGERDRRYGYPDSTMLLSALYFAPPGSTGISADPAHGDISSLQTSGTEDGRSVRTVTVAVPKGQSKTVSFTSTLPKGALGPMSVRYSPTVTTTPVTVAPSCGQLTGK